VTPVDRRTLGARGHCPDHACAPASRFDMQALDGRCTQRTAGPLSGAAHAAPA